MTRISPRRGFGRRLTLAVVPAVLAIGGGTAIAQSDVSPRSAAAATTTPIFLKLDGVAGESTNPQHPGEIDVQGFDFAVSNTTDAAGGGAGTGKAVFAPIKFTKTVDKSSPLLMLRTATGQHMATATFSFKRPGADGFLTYKLTDVTVTSYEQGGDSPLTEHVELTYSKIVVSYLPVAGPPLVTAGWDTKLNAPAV